MKMETTVRRLTGRKKDRYLRLKQRVALLEDGMFRDPVGY